MVNVFHSDPQISFFQVLQIFCEIVFFKLAVRRGWGHPKLDTMHAASMVVVGAVRNVNFNLIKA